MTSYTRPEGDPHDWAAVSRWIDAGKPPLNPDGSWQQPTETEDQ